MCGICGFVGENEASILDDMIKYIRPRGPDSEGKYSNKNINLAATRLAIRDIKNGTQPFIHKDLKLITVFNGEIYNYNELKKIIEEKGYSFKTLCDTELLAPGYYYFGEKFFSLIDGMFAFAIFDEKNNKTLLCRDRFGIKPLYYSNIKDNFYFSSSAKSIFNLKFFNKKINLQNFCSILSKRYVSKNEHIFEEVSQVAPGEILFIQNNIVKKSNFLNHIKLKNYNKIDELNFEIENFFSDKINSFCLSDVPIGIMLSSGLDSSLIYNSLKNKNLEAFTLDFGNTAFNESLEVKKNLHNQNNLEICKFNSKNFNEIFEDTIKCFDNPITDSVIFPTNFLMKKIAQKKKVAFSGEGADEIFGGYYYFKLLNKISTIDKLKLSIPLSYLLKLMPPSFMNIFFSYQGKLGRFGKERLVNSLKNGFNTQNDFENLISIFSRDDQNKIFSNKIKISNYNSDDRLSKKLTIQKNFNEWLPNYNLYKTDQMSMNNGLEIRVPYLNNTFYDIFQFISKNLQKNFYEDKLLLKNYATKIKLKQRKKIALQNYMDEENMNVFINLMKDKLNKNNSLFDLINYDDTETLISNYQKSPELLLEKKLSSILILSEWFNQNV